jgi:hypothetical protein
MNWSACKAVIKDWPSAGLHELVHELYNLNAENRRFLHARLLSAGRGPLVAESLSALKHILSIPSIYEGNFSHSGAKRIIDQFAKATGDTGAVCDLLCSDLEISLASLSQTGDDENLVDHVYASMTRLGQLAPELPMESYRSIADRIATLAKKWSGKFGYGISDELNDLGAELKYRLDS